MIRVGSFIINTGIPHRDKVVPNVTNCTGFNVKSFKTIHYFRRESKTLLRSLEYILFQVSCAEREKNVIHRGGKKYVFFYALLSYTYIHTFNIFTTMYAKREGAEERENVQCNKKLTFFAR